MEPEGSLQHSQMPATCPYPEPARSSPYPPSHFLKIRLNIILPSTSGSLKWSLSLRFPHRNPVYACPLLHTRYVLRLFHSSRFYHPDSSSGTIPQIKNHFHRFFSSSSSKHPNHSGPFPGPPANRFVTPVHIMLRLTCWTVSIACHVFLWC